MKKYIRSSITIKCYGDTKEWENRDEAIEFYKEAVAACDGAEKCRYADILVALLDGETDIDADY